ncbi:MAG: hypothetical protein HYS35_08285 [Betaproteobacteria bacterium]|nr:hypothetical protein [Betaproteobacteria bacterium]
MIVVLYASAAIRLGQTAAPPLDAGTLSALRAAHRAAASLEVIVALWLGWLAWRARREQPLLARGAWLVLALTAALSALGVAAGRTPPPAAALGNLLGGLALAAAFAWVLGRLRNRASPAGVGVARLGAPLLAAQCLLGAALSILPGASASAALPAHGMLGIVLASAAIWLALRSAPAVRRATGFALALLVPVAGFTALHFERSSAAAFAHAAAAALVVIAASYARFRPA